MRIRAGRGGESRGEEQPREPPRQGRGTVSQRHNGVTSHAVCEEHPSPTWKLSWGSQEGYIQREKIGQAPNNNAAPIYVCKNLTSVVTMFLVPKVATISHTDVGCRRDNRKVRWCVKSVVVPDGDVLVVGCVLVSKRKV